MRELHRARNNPANYQFDNAPVPDVLREDLNRAFESMSKLIPVYPVLGKSTFMIIFDNKTELVLGPQLSSLRGMRQSMQV